MMLKKVALAGASFLCLAHHAQAQDFNQLIAFGDSTTDTGWFANASIGLPGNPVASVIDQWYKNAVANGGEVHFTGPGPGNAQILGSFFNLPANPANTPGGTNFATGGALNGDTLGPGLGNQFSYFFSFLPSALGGGANPNLPSTAGQIGNYLASVNGHADPNALYLISSGGNDVFLASRIIRLAQPFQQLAQAFPGLAQLLAQTFPGLSQAFPGLVAQQLPSFLNGTFISSEAQALAHAAAGLQQAGARYIIVSNQYLPPSTANDPTAVKLGMNLFNDTLNDLNAAGVKFIFADTQSVTIAVELNLEAFGFTAPSSTEACVRPTPTGFGSGAVCANTTTPPPPLTLQMPLTSLLAQYGYLVSADATQTHLFLDGTHFTEAGERIIAQYYDSLVTQHWDGSATVGDGPVNNANLSADGGNGTWDNTSTNWATSIGTINSAWNGISAIFGGAPGTVTVAAPIAYQSIEFSTDGYLLTASAGGTLMPTGVAPIIVDGGLSATIATSITGSGGVGKNGLGTLILTGADTYTGPTNIDGGALQVDGSIAGSSLTTVNTGTMLSGTGTVGNTQVNNRATFAPGNGTPGTSMTVAGNLAFQSGAVYMVFLNSTTSSFVNVTGTASLAGTVNAVFAPGSSVRNQYLILHSGQGFAGTTFSDLTTNFPAGLTTSLSYSADPDVFLNLTAALGSGTTLNVNQRNVANAIDNFFNSGGTLPPGFANLFNSSGASLANSLAQIDGEDATGAERSAFQLTNEFLSLMLDPNVATSDVAPSQPANSPPAGYEAPVNKASPAPTFEQRWTAWAAGFGTGGTANGDPAIGSNDVTSSTFGYAAGMDYHYSPDTVLGFALAGGGTNWGLAHGLGSGRSDAFLAGTYGITRQGPVYLAGAFAFADNWFTTDRTALGEPLSASFQGQDYAGRLEGGYRFAVPVADETFGITPYTAIQAQDFHTPAYSESDMGAGGFGLSYDAQNGTDTRSELGGRFDDSTTLYAVPLTLRARVAWAHDWVSTPALNASFESLPGSHFSVFGAPIPHDSALTSASAQLNFTPNWSFIAKFDGEFASGSQIYAGSGTLRDTW